jgi:2,3-bisphosphoglycerate-dependent phosphoglycerate mutase
MHPIVASLLLVLAFVSAPSLPAGSIEERGQERGAGSKGVRTREFYTLAARGETPGSQLSDAFLSNPIDPDDQVTGVAPGSAADRGPAIVFLVRHAERADAGMAAATIAGADPVLSEAGKARAQALGRMLKDARLAAIFTTEYRRTKDTALPVATSAGIAAEAVESKNTAALLDKIKQSSGNVLVVGHSNTVPEIIKGLGVTEPVTIAEGDFDELFVVVRGTPPALVRLHY